MARKYTMHGDYNNACILIVNNTQTKPLSRKKRRLKRTADN